MSALCQKRTFLIGPGTFKKLAVDLERDSLVIHGLITEAVDFPICHVDCFAPAEERARRKRRLIQGPREFREIRADWRKTKG